MNWLLLSNETKDNEWAATNIGQDHFEKLWGIYILNKNGLIV